MDWTQIGAEREAIESLMVLYTQAEKCKELYEKAGMALPEALQRFLGMSESTAKSTSQKNPKVGIQIPSPERRNVPESADRDWISVDLKDASPTSVMLAILRQADVPMRARDVNAGVTEIFPDVLSGTIANAGTRLQGEGVIERGDEGWRLLRPEIAGVIHEGTLWGPASIFGKHESAAHRRYAIQHVLRQFSAGLQIVQIVEHLGACSWVHAPVNKDLLKADMAALSAEGKVRRRGNSKKWEISE
jgi:hypothetical protein